MTKPDNKQSTNPIVKTLIPASILGVVGIGSFVVIYISLAQTDIGPFPSLILAFCIPPTAIAVLIGFYVLFGPKRNQTD